MAKSPLEKIADIKAAAAAKIAELQAAADKEESELKAAALAELKEKRKAAASVLQGIDDAIAELTGKAASKSKKSAAGKLPDVPSAASLKSLLTKAGKELNRKALADAGYNLPSAIALAKANPDTFKFKQNKAQGSVWLK